MSLLLMNRGTNPEVSVKTFGVGPVGTVHFGDYEVSMADFLMAAHYVLTNTNLDPYDDPRRQFVECVKRMQETEGWMGQGTRLKSDVHPVDEEANTDPG